MWPRAARCCDFATNAELRVFSRSVRQSSSLPVMPLSARTIIAVLLSLVGAWECNAQNWRESFETAQPSWRETGGDARHRILHQERLPRRGHTPARVASGCKSRPKAAPHFYLAHDVGHPAVIDELLPSVWVKSDRPGLQLAARVVLPRTADPRTGKPLATIVFGEQLQRRRPLAAVAAPAESRAC